MMPIVRSFSTGAESPADKIFPALGAAPRSGATHEIDFSAAMAKVTAERNAEQERSGAGATAAAREGTNGTDRTNPRSSTGESEHASISLRRASMGTPQPRLGTAQISQQNGAQSRLKTVSSGEARQPGAPAAPQTKPAATTKQSTATDSFSDATGEEGGHEREETPSQTDGTSDSDSQGQSNPSNLQGNATSQGFDALGIPLLNATVAAAPGPSQAQSATAKGLGQTATQDLPAQTAQGPSVPDSATGAKAVPSAALTPASLAAAPEAKTGATAKPQSDLNNPAPAKPDAETAPISDRFKAAGPQPEPGNQIAAALAPALSGTAVATNASQMKWSPEQNEFAQLATQKVSFDQADVPGDSQTGGAGGKDGGSFASDFTSNKSFEMFSTYGAAGTVTGSNSAPGEQGEGAAATSALPARIEQVQNLLTREIVMVRQSGADSLAVSLKIDSHTDLLLQLTNHNGQIEAAVRCERGDLSTLNSHWAQLQDSLARQNVHLLPLEDRTGSRLASGAADEGFSTQDFDQKTSRNDPSPSGEGDSTTPSGSRAAATTVNKPQTRKSPAKGWESWA